MRKIPTLFVRDETTRKITRQVHPECQWVLDGEGVATVKFDGTCCLIREGQLYKRYDAKKGKTPPADWEPAQENPDPITSHWPGWLPVGDGPEDQYHREALEATIGHSDRPLRDTTYELVGPKVQGNPYGLTFRQLWSHGSVILGNIPADLGFGTLHQWLTDHVVEGIVWHHPDGRMAKLKRKDFGLPWPVRAKGDA